MSSAARYAVGSSGSKTLPSKKVSLPREVEAGTLARRDAELLCRLAPEVLAVDLGDQRLGVDVCLELAPADVLGDEPEVMTLERIGGVVGPVAHHMRAVLDDAPGAVVEPALDAVGHVVDRAVDPLALGADRGDLGAVLQPFAPLLRLHDGHQQRLCGLGVPVDVGGAQGEGFLRVPLPELTGGDRRVADVLMDELQVPGLADAEAVHRADLHVRHHLGRRHDDGLDVPVGIDAAGGEPVADPQIVRAAREGHGGLDRLAGGLLLLQRLAKRLGVEPDLDVGVFLRDRDALAVKIEPGEDVHRRRHVVLRHLAGADEVGHRREDVGAVDAIALGAEHEVVARRAPRGLLLDLDVGHAMFGEEALLLGDEERRRVGQGDEAELCRLRLRTGALREGAARKCRLGRGHERESRPALLQHLTPREPFRLAHHPCTFPSSCCAGHDCH